MRSTIGAEDRYVEGPNVRWLLEDGMYTCSHRVRFASRETSSRAFVDRHDVKYVIAEMDSMHKFRYRGGLIDRQLKFQGVLDFRSAGGN